MTEKKEKKFLIADWASFFVRTYEYAYNSKISILKTNGIDVYTKHQFRSNPKLEKATGIPIRMNEEITYEQLIEESQKSDVISIYLVLETEKYDIQFVSRGDSVGCIYEDDEELSVATKLFQEINKPTG